MWLDVGIDCVGTLSDRRHAAEMEVPIIGSSTLPYISVEEFSSSKRRGSIRMPLSWGGVAGGSSPDSIFVSRGGKSSEMP